MWTGKFDLNRDTFGRGKTRKLLNPGRKFRGFQKYPDTFGRGLIKFTCFDSCLVFFDFDILSLIKKKNIFCFSFSF